MNEKSIGDSVGTGARVERPLGARTALIAGFGALLVLMAIICGDSLRTLAAFAADNAQIRRDFLYREQTLTQVRTSLYESGDVMRDYIFVESQPDLQKTLEADLRSIREQAGASLAACIQQLPAGQGAPFEDLQREMGRYWSMLDPIFKLSDEEKKQKGGFLLQNEVLQQHLRILAITKDVSAINSDDLREAEQKTEQVFVEFRRRLLIAGTVAVGLGLILAGATIAYVGRLERSVEEKYVQSVAARNELHKLSKRLVDAEERERRTISRELHDQVGQSLSALLVDVEGLASLPDEKGIFRRGLKNIRALAETSVNEVRNMALLLRPSMLDDLGLVAAVEWQAREVSKRTEMLVDTVDENVPDDLPEDHKTCVYRVVQEALNNCSKHAQAKHARVTLRRVADHLQVMIEDDGKGFDADRVRGLGLVGMNERVRQLAGMLKVESEPGRGTRVSVDLPLAGA
ncbi:MAG TPA: sensor histidine kinase [Candidatus Acidoferrales bacterium]